MELNPWVTGGKFAEFLSKNDVNRRANRVENGDSCIEITGGCLSGEGAEWSHARPTCDAD